MAIITVGETAVLSNPGGPSANVLYSYGPYTLSQMATIQSLTWYMGMATVANIRLGIYDATGPSSGPGALQAQTASFLVTTAATAAWQTANVITPVILSSASYWVAIVSDSAFNGFYIVSGATGKFASFTYGAMPSTFPASPSTDAAHYSFYASLDTGAGAPVLISGGAPRMTGWAYS
jgi:hypothetical protein